MEKSAENTAMTTRKSPPASNQIILVVDDNADLLGVTKMVLEVNDFKVFTALSGTEALSILTEINKPDLILLDMRMEEMSGPEFLLILEKKLPEIFESVPVVFMSGEENIPISKAVGSIRKPFDMDEFLAAVHRYIEIGTSQIRLN